MGWYNNDGLYIKYGTEEGQVSNVGTYDFTGPLNLTEATIDLASLASTDTILSRDASIPKNARIEKVEVEVYTAATSGGSATLSVGLYKTDYTSVVGAAGIVSALALTSINAVGQLVTLTAGSTSAGTLIGTTISANSPTTPVVISAKYTTAAFTAGRVAVRIYWSVPS